MWTSVHETKAENLKLENSMSQINAAIEITNKNISADIVFFFDLDGTLVDTNFANFLSYKKAIQTVTTLEINLNFNPDKRFNRSCLKNAIPNLSENEYEKIIEEKELYFSDFLPETKLNKVVTEILYKYSKTNKAVLVTNCRKDRALTTLNHFGITDKFNNIFYRQFAKNEGKINKFQNAISVLKIAPKSIIAFENEESEIIDARNAGIQIINPTHL